MSAAATWYRVLMPAVDQHANGPRGVKPATRKVARVLCDLAAEGHTTETVFGGAYEVARRAADYNGGNELNPRTVQRSLLELQDCGLIQKVAKGGRGRLGARLPRGGRGIANVYALGASLLARVARLGRRVSRYAIRHLDRNYGRTAVPTGDLKITSPDTKVSAWADVSGSPPWRPRSLGERALALGRMLTGAGPADAGDADVSLTGTTAPWAKHPEPISGAITPGRPTRNGHGAAT